MLMAGIWDCMTNDQVVEYIRKRIAGGQSLGEICENIMENCLASDSDMGGYGCDNMTIIIVAILNGKSYTEWATQIAKKVPQEEHVMKVAVVEETETEDHDEEEDVDETETGAGNV
jgi:protein phosphatase 2C family protein 2/3